jgi:hypothetical protein
MFQPRARTNHCSLHVPYPIISADGSCPRGRYVRVVILIVWECRELDEHKDKETRPREAIITMSLEFAHVKPDLLDVCRKS